MNTSTFAWTYAHAVVSYKRSIVGVIIYVFFCFFIPLLKVPPTHVLETRCRSFPRKYKECTTFILVSSPSLCVRPERYNV